MSELLGVAAVELSVDQRGLISGLAAAERTTQGSLDRMHANVGQKMASMGNSMSSLGSKMTHTVTAPLVGLGAVTMKFASDFESAMTQVETQAGASAKEIDNMRGALLKLAPAVGQTPVQLANGLYRVESAGFRGAKALDILTQSAKLAKIGHADLEQTTSALVAVMTTAPKDVKNATDAIGLLNSIVGQGNMRMQDMVGALSTGILPVAKSVGLGFRDVGAAIDVMTSRGVPAQDAATRLRMTLSLMAAPTDKAAGALGSIGLKSDTLAKDMRKPDGLVVALKDLKGHLEHAGLSATQQTQVIAQAFGGGRTSSAITTLLQNVGDVKTNFDQVGKKAGEVGDAWHKTTQDMGFKWDQLKSKAEATAISIGTKVGPTFLNIGAKLADDVGKIADAFTKLPKGAQDAIIRGGLVMAGIGPALRLLGVFTTAIGGAYKLFSKLGSGPSILGNATGAGKSVMPIAAMEVNTMIVKSMVGGGGIGGGGVGMNGAVTAAETGAAERSAMSRIMGGLRGGLGMAMRGFGIFAGGEILTQIGGYIAGHGAAGDWVKSIGTGASVGAALGSVIGQPAAGALVGALISGIGHWISSDAKKEGNKWADEFVKNIPGHISDAVKKGVHDSATEPAPSPNEPQPHTRSPSGIGEASLTQVQDALKLARTQLANAQRMAAKGMPPQAGEPDVKTAAARVQHLQTEYNTLFNTWYKKMFNAAWKAGQTSGQAVVDGMKSQSHHNVFFMTNEAMKTLLTPPPNVKGAAVKVWRDTAAQQIIEYTRGLESKHQLPAGSTDRMIKTLEAKFPGLQVFLKKQGEDTGKNVANTMDFKAARSKLTNFVAKFRDNYGDANISAKLTNDNIVKNANTMWADLTYARNHSQGKERQDYQNQLSTLAGYTKDYYKQQDQTTSAGYDQIGNTTDKKGKHIRDLWNNALADLQTATKLHTGVTKDDFLNTFQQLRDQGGPKFTGIKNDAILAFTALQGGVGPIGDKTAQAMYTAFKAMGLNATELANALGIKVPQIDLSYPKSAIQKYDAAKTNQLIRSGRAGGGLVQIGQAGDAGRDNIPMSVGGQDIMVGSGEQALIVNRHQQGFLNRVLSPIGGLTGMFDHINTPHYMSVGGKVAGLHPDFIGELSALSNAAHVNISVNSGYRSPAEQAKLFAAHPDPKWVARPGTSQHQTGEAADIAPSRSAFHGLESQYGLYFPMDYEPWHIANVILRGGKGMAGGAAPQLGRTLLNMPDGVLKKLGQGGIDRARDQWNKWLSAHAPAPSGAMSAAGFKGGGNSAANRALGHKMMLASPFNWGENQWSALDNLWIGESGWDANAVNKSSGAAGIPQALGHGNVFRLGDAAAQIAWGLNYIHDRYGSPAAAYSAWLARSPHWYARGGLINAAKGYSSGGGGLGPPKRKNLSGKQPPKKGKRHPHHYRSIMSQIMAGHPTWFRNLESKSHKGTDLQAIGKAFKKMTGYLSDVDVIQERLQYTSSNDDLTDFTFMLNPGDPGYSLPTDALNQQVPQISVQDFKALMDDKGDYTGAYTGDWTPSLTSSFAVNQRLGQLYQLRGFDTNILGKTSKAMQLTDPLLQTVKKAIERRRKHIKDRQADIKKRKDEIRANLERIKKLLKQLEDAKKTKLPKDTKATHSAYLAAKQAKAKKVDGINGEIRKLKDKNEKLGGDRTKIGTGGEIGTLQKRIDTLHNEIGDGPSPIDPNLQDDIKTITDAQTQVHGVSGMGGLDGDTNLAIRQLDKDINAISAVGMQTQFTQGIQKGSASSDDSAMVALLKQQNTILAQQYAVSQAQYSVLSQLPSFGGTFHRGGIVPGPFGAERLVLATGGEVISPAGSNVSVTNSFANGMQWLDRYVDTRIEDHTRKNSRRAARGLPGRGGGLM